MLEPLKIEKSNPAAGHSLSATVDHVRLNAFNRRRLNPAVPDDSWEEELSAALENLRAEGWFIEDARASVAFEIDRVPRNAAGFLEWYEKLLSTGPGQNDPLFPWLATEASSSQMKWFLTQEVAGEAGFEDLVALTQVKLPTRAKLELARNYWDEMGRGTETGMHGPMLARLADEFKIGAVPAEQIVPEALALANLLVALAANRRYAYQSLGALGAIELTAPSRARLVLKGLERLGYHQAAQYYRLHSTLDVKHSRDWNTEIIAPLVHARPDVIPYLAEGAWLRLEFGRRCFDRYREVLWEKRH